MLLTATFAIEMPEAEAFDLMRKRDEVERRLKKNVICTAGLKSAQTQLVVNFSFGFFTLTGKLTSRSLLIFIA